MLAELRTKSQITLPKTIVNALGLSKGDKLEVFERDGVIYMVPVIVYPKKYVDELHGELSQMLERIKSGEQPVFDSIDELIDKLEEK
ncbi:MAG: AbrB/MazE/SpoVT family DNA-binding domain-containing protein [Clostridia bacterium]|nr:AbrB/MazE/SpoVT family DNA-binding domain-containing protein [Clostridia bacterium]MBO7406153.1 AbrB/MazE/SpoVT family DNA-binding domain-containing protein [Clostridia bacterium]